MKLKNLKEFLNNNNIYLYDCQYRIINSLISKKQVGGGNYKYNLNNILGNNQSQISFNINKLLK